MDALDQLVSDNAGGVVVVFGLLWAVLVVQAQGLLWAGKRELTRIWEGESAQNGRLEDIGQQVSGIEAKLPNGDLKLALAKLEVIDKKVEAVAKDVKDHNCDAETWKREIVEHRVRLDHLESK